MTTNRYLYRETAEGFPLYRRVRGEGLAFVRFFRTREEARREVYRLNGWKMRGAPILARPFLAREPPRERWRGGSGKVWKTAARGPAPPARQS